MNFNKGDIVTRDGTDEHLIVSLDDFLGDLILVVCIKAPNSGWIKIGDTEWNLPRRYSFIEKCFNIKEILIKCNRLDLFNLYFEEKDT